MTGVTTFSVLSLVCLVDMLTSIVARLGGGRIGGAGPVKSIESRPVNTGMNSYISVSAPS